MTGKVLQFRKKKALTWRRQEPGLYGGSPADPWGYEYTVDKTVRGAWIAVWHPPIAFDTTNDRSKLVGVFGRLKDAKAACEAEASR